MSEKKTEVEPSTEEEEGEKRKRKKERSKYEWIAYEIADTLLSLNIRNLNQRLERLFTFKNQIFSSLDQIPKHMIGSLGEAFKAVDLRLDLSGFDLHKINWPKIDRDNLASIDWRRINLNVVIPHLASVDWGNIDWSKIDLTRIDLGKIDFGKIDWGKIDFGNIDWGNIDWGDIDLGSDDSGAALILLVVIGVAVGTVAVSAAVYDYYQKRKKEEDSKSGEGRS